MQKLKILLVDDDENILEVIGERIRSWGYDLLTASDGDQALSVLKNQNPDSIILDYMMPGKDGMATLKAIRKINKNVSVIMLTAHPDEKLMKGSDELNVSAFIPKLSAHSDTQTALRTAIYMATKQLKK